MRVELHHGVDLVHIPRIRRIWLAHGDHFLTRVFTPAERAYALGARQAEITLAGRFAVKEAVFKALGTGWRGGIEWTDVETLPDRLGRPCLTLHGKAAHRGELLNIRRWTISISHAGEYAMASAIGWE